VIRLNFHKWVDSALGWPVVENTFFTFPVPDKAFIYPLYSKVQQLMAQKVYIYVLIFVCDSGFYHILSVC